MIHQRYPATASALSSVRNTLSIFVASAALVQVRLFSGMMVLYSPSALLWAFYLTLGFLTQWCLKQRIQWLEVSTETWYQKSKNKCTSEPITVVKWLYYWDPVAHINPSWKCAFQHQNESSDVLLMSIFWCIRWTEAELKWWYRQLVMNIFRFESASCFSQCEARRQQQSADCDEDLLYLKMHVGAASIEHL